MKYKLSHVEVLEHWNDQLNFMESSCKTFDLGDEKEARRIATSLRTLFHETQTSKSLLSQLNFSMMFYSSGSMYIPSNLLSSWVLLCMEFSNKGLIYKPNFENQERAFFLDFSDWWNEIIFDDKKDIFTRRDIVLFIANQDGGAHVDPEIKEKFANLTKLNSLGWSDGKGSSPTNNPAYQAVRAIANEVMISVKLFNLGYKNRRRQKERSFEMRFKDDKRRYKWSSTEINASEETLQIVNKDRSEKRKLYIQELANAKRVEYVGL